MAKIMMSDLLTPLSEKERQELEAAERMTPSFDEDSPEMTSAQLRQFKPMTRDGFAVSVFLSPITYDKVRVYGKKDRTFLSRLIDVAINDENLVRKCV